MRRKIAALWILICLLVLVVLFAGRRGARTATAPTVPPPPVSRAVEEAKYYVRGGIGAILTVGTNGSTRIASITPDSPAALAGLQAGDALVRVDGHPVAGLKLAEVVERVRGYLGTSVEVTILRGTSTNPVNVTIRRTSFHSLGIRPTSPPPLVPAQLPPKSSTN